MKNEETIEIISCRYSIDWTYDKKHTINLSEIWGFQLHWRGDDWHVVVVTKNKTKDDIYSTYEIIKLINDPRVTIREIVNYHRSSNFIDEIANITRKT